MTEEKHQFIRKLAKENNSLVQSMLRPFTSDGVQTILDRITSFERLIRIIQGLPCDKQWLSVELALLYNYSLVSRFATAPKASVLSGSLGRNALGTRTLRFGANPEKTSDDAIRAFLSRVEELTSDKVFRRSTRNEHIVLSSQLIELLLSASFPGSTKAMLLRFCVAFCLNLLNRGRLKDASDMSLQMLDQVLPRLADLLLIDSVDSNLNLPQICSEPTSTADALLLADSVRVVTAVSSLRLRDWNQCLACVRQTVTFPLKLYCLYVEGYVLYQQKTIEAALSLLCELIKRVDLSRELLLDVRNLIGCCLSSQGKHRSAIQVFKKCLQDDFTFLLPLYNIAIQYRKLLLFDAEIETLQLLDKLLESSQQVKRANDSDFVQFDDAGQSSSSRSQPISRCQVLQLLAARCLALNRYSDAVDAYQSLISHLSTVGQHLESGSTEVNPNNSFSIDLLYSRTIYANIRANKFDEALTLCDDILSKTDQTLESDFSSQSHVRQLRSSCSTVGQSNLTSTQPKVSLEAEVPRMTGKRLREEGEDCVSERDESAVGISPDVKCRLFDAAVLLYKAEALANVDEREDSLVCVNQAIAILESNWMDSGVRRFEEPRVKKMKVDSSTEGGKQPCVWREMLSDAYGTKGLILITLDRTQDALHWSRLAYQLNDSDTEKVYNLSLLLYKLQRNSEASSLWLTHRDLAASHDSLQLDVLLKRCSANLGKLTATEITSSKGRYCLLDVEALKILRTVKHKT